MLMPFSSFLSEASLIRHIYKNDKFDHSDVTDRGKTTPEKLDNQGYSKISTLGNHNIYHGRSYIGGSLQDEYIAHNKTTGKIDMSVYGTTKKHKKGTTFNIETLAGRTGSTLKAHDLYHHLITKHDHILVGTTHSVGGQKVWQKLAKKTGVGVHGWLRGKPVNLNPLDSEETHVPFKEFATSDPSEKSTRDTFQTKLIAHRKPTK